MASSNRHWPSMFKSKPCNNHHQWQHDINSSLISSCQRPPYTSGFEERSPDPKPRWNPKPEQIRILEAIFNSGMVNPPRDEIRKIRTQLQEYGQVGDANVFYWFQNRKSRSKHKQRHLQTSKSHSQSPPVNTFTTAPSSSSSSSSEKSSPKKTNKMLAMGGVNMIDLSNSPTASVNQTYFQTQGDFSSDQPFFFPVQQIEGNTAFSQGFCFSDISNVQIPDQTIGSCSGFLIGELLNQEVSKEEEEKMKFHQQLSYIHSSTTTTTLTTSIPLTITSPTSTINPTTFNQIQGVGESGAVDPADAGRSTVFINDVAFEVSVGPFNVRQAFGDDAVLLHSSGQPVLTNQWGVTFQSLQPGAFYYLV